MEGEYLEFLNFDYYIEHSLRLGIFQRGSPRYFLSLRRNVPFSEGKKPASNEYEAGRDSFRRREKERDEEVRETQMRQLGHVPFVRLLRSACISRPR